MSKDVESLAYELAFEELEKVVADLESEVHNLDEALKLFERGQALAKRCSTLLDTAELRVKQLTAEGDLRDLD
jgi:exodeoxyribonuclease VII small subunit